MLSVRRRHIESGMPDMCRMHHAMSVSTVLQCGDAVSPGGKHACATAMFCFLYRDDVWLRAVYEVFSSSILFLMPFMLI